MFAVATTAVQRRVIFAYVRACTSTCKEEASYFAQAANMRVSACVGVGQPALAENLEARVSASALPANSVSAMKKAPAHASLARGAMNPND